MSDAPIIVAEGLGKTFEVADKQPGLGGALRHLFARKMKTVEAVKDATLAVHPGEVVGFLGPNGAGKTTTLKMLTGLIHPTTGRCRVAGHEPFKRNKDFLRRITLVMGNKQQLLWDLPANDSLRIQAAVYEIPADEAERRKRELAELLEVEDKLSQPVRKLSLGERMKVELLASLLHRPDVLFLDEPTLGLDVNAQATIREFLKRYNEQYGATVLLTSHYMADITALCERVILIHDGQLMYDGLLDALLEQHTPFREIRLQTGTPPEADTLPGLETPLSIDGHVVTVQVPRERLPSAVALLLEHLDVTDLSVADPPVEDIIARLFKGAGGKPPPDNDDHEAIA
jgi:ABC-2 type transport system ATP-binding protein